MADEARTVTVEEFAALKASQGALEAKLAEAEAARVQAQAEAERHGAAVKAMQFSARVERADRMLEKWSNRIPPAAREEAKALLLTEGVVKFADGEKDSAELFAAFCEKLPVQKPAALTGGAGAPSAEVKFTDDEKAFYAKAFPGLKLEDIAAANPELFAGR